MASKRRTSSKSSTGKKTGARRSASSKAKTSSRTTSAKRGSRKGTQRKRKVTKAQAEKAAKEYQRRADRYKDPEKAQELADEALEKAKQRKGPLKEVLGDLMTMIRMIQAYAKREYRAVPWGTMAVIIGGVVYFVSPVDLIPDPIPVVGFLDDAAVLALIIAQVRADLDDFLVWETERETAD
jgi:uncharacterized membrane protein YkvA (DUF1232 family)